MRTDKMKNQNKIPLFLRKLEKHADNAHADIECLSVICKDNEYHQVSRTISFLHHEIGQIRGLVWEQMEKLEKKLRRKK